MYSKLNTGPGLLTNPLECPYVTVTGTALGTVVPTRRRREGGGPFRRFPGARGTIAATSCPVKHRQ